MGYPTRTEGVRKNLPGGRGQTFGLRGVGQGIYEASDTPKHLVGDKLELWGDRVFRYGHFIADYTTQYVAGYLVAPDISANDLLLDNKVVDVATSVGNYPPTAGQKVIELTGTATKNQFQNGTMHITDDSGEGYTYLIKRNSATGVKLDSDDMALNATTSFMVELYDGLVIALDTTSELYIVGNLYNNLIVATTTDIQAVGVSMLAIDYSDKAYAWVQTWGPATVLAGGAITEGDVLQLEDAGACAVMASYTEPVIGYALADADSGDQCAAFLRISR